MPRALRARRAGRQPLASSLLPLDPIRMPIDVKWFPTLIKRTKSKQPFTTVDHAAGLTPQRIFMDEGFNQADAESVLVLINDEQQDMDTALNDGDRLEFMVSIQGG